MKLILLIALLGAVIIHIEYRDLYKAEERMYLSTAFSEQLRFNRLYLNRFHPDPCTHLFYTWTPKGITGMAMELKPGCTEGWIHL